MLKTKWTTRLSPPRRAWARILLCSLLASCTGDATAPQAPFQTDGRTVIGADNPLEDCDADGATRFHSNSETEPMVVVNPMDSNHLMTVWRQDSFYDFGSRGAVSAVTFDGGETWAEVVIPGLGQCSGGEKGRVAHPLIAFGAQGHLYNLVSVIRGDVEDPFYEESLNDVVVGSSSDGGLSWTAPLTLAVGGRDRSNFAASIVADEVKPCVAYAAWYRLEASSDGKQLRSTELLQTTDCGASWRPAGFPDEATQVRLATLSDGSLHVLYLQTLPFNPSVGAREYELRARRSADGGQTWSDSVLVSYFERLSPSSQATFLFRTGILDIATDPEAGALYAVWEQHFDQWLTQVAFSRSLDGGSTWSRPVQIDRTPLYSNGYPRQAFLPAIAVSDEGTIGVTYYNTQHDTSDLAGASSDRWFISCDGRSRDCGEPGSWTDQVRLTTASFDYLGAPNQNGSTLGAWSGLTSAGDAFFAVTRPNDAGDVVFIPLRPAESDSPL